MLARSSPRALATIASMLLACGVGLFVLAAHGEPASRLGLQAAAAALGTVVWFVLTRVEGRRLTRWLPLAAALCLLALAATLLGPGTLGVRRWVGLGPVSLHPSAIGAPILLAAAALGVARPARSWGILLLAQGIHLLQPDAGQATALAVGGAVVFAAAPSPPLARYGATGSLFLIAALSWIRPDPLSPVPSVEGIVTLASEISVLTGGVALVALAAMPLSLAFATGASAPGDGASPLAARALSAHLASSVLVGLFGNYPVPALGFGVSPILGVSLAMGLGVAMAAGESGARGSVLSGGAGQ